MCVVSMIGDHYREMFPQKPYWPQIEPAIWPSPSSPDTPLPAPIAPYGPMSPVGPAVVMPITREEFDDLKKTVIEMKKLLERAKEYDAKNGEPDCEIEDKVAFIKKIAEFVGVDIDVK